MGEHLNKLRQLIKEELDIALQESELDDIVDYLIDDEGEDQTDTQEDELEEGRQGRVLGNSRLYKLKGSHTADEVKSFLKKVQSKIEKRKTQGRKANNFTDEDIEAFAEILTKPEGFDRHDIVNTLSFYKNKPNGFRAAQKMMDVLGDNKLTTNLDEKGNSITIGKGYIEVLDRPKKEKNTDDLDDDSTLSMDELEPTSFEDDDYPTEEDYQINETVKMFQKRAGILHG